MRSLFKKSVSLLLAVITLFGVMPFAFAAEKESIIDIESRIEEINNSIGFDEMSSPRESLESRKDAGETATEEVPYTSGMYTYTVDESGNATIIGCDTSISGEITVPSSLGGYPVTALASTAYENCTEITGVTVPDSITTNEAGFYYCKNIEYISLPISVNNDISVPFSPSEVTANGNRATIRWSDDDKTTTLYIGESLSDFESFFQTVSTCLLTLEEIKLSESNTSFRLVDGVLYNYDVTTFYLYPLASEKTEYVMPDTVKWSSDTVLYHDFLYYAPCLTSITIGKNFNIGFEDAETYHEWYSDLVEAYGEECALNYIPNMIMALGDGSSHGCLFPLAANLKEINVSEVHEYLTSKDGALYLKNDKYDVLLVHPAGKEGTITLGDNDIVYNYAFLGLTDSRKVVITEGFCDTLYAASEGLYSAYVEEAEYEAKVKEYYNQSIVTLLTYSRASEYSVDESNTRYSVDEYGVLYSKDGKELIKFPSGSELTVYKIADGTVFTSAAFMGFSPLTMELYYPKNLTVHIDDIDILTNTVPVCKTICTSLPEDTEFTVTEGEEEVVYTLEAFFEEYNSLVDEMKAELEASYAELDAMVEEVYGTIDSEAHVIYIEYVIGIYKNMLCMFGGGYMPEMEFCGGHKVEVPEEPTTQPEEPTTQPEEPTTKPEEPTTKPEEPATKPAVPDEPTADNEIIPSPTRSEISYGDAIILRVDPAKIPEGGYVVWSADNDNFSYTVADDGTCTITPESSGDTTFTATIYDAEDNAVSTDGQTMTSKAGFFQKLIAFFKKLFGLTKIYEQAFRV